MSAGSLVLKRWFKGLLVIALAVTAGLILGVLLTTLLAESRPAASLAEVENDLVRAQAAANARYAAMDAFYGATTGDNFRRARSAEAARYAAMDAFYGAIAADNLQRARSAEAARYAAMDAFYGLAKP